jgi:hypothetical protein
METAVAEQQSQNTDTQSEQSPIQEKTKRTFSERAATLISFISRSRTEAANPNVVLQTIAQGEINEASSPVDIQTEKILEEANNEVRLLRKAWDMIRAHPEFLGAGMSVTLGVLAMMADTPLPPGILQGASSALGFASVGYGKGESTHQKIAFAAAGAIAGTAGMEGVGSLVGQEHAAKVNLVGGFVDDLVPVAGLAAGIVKGRSQGRAEQPKPAPAPKVEPIKNSA